MIVTGHRTERNEVYTFVIASRTYRVIGDLYPAATMYGSEHRIDAGTEAIRAEHWLRFPELYRCDG